jgi:hypothetical protein
VTGANASSRTQEQNQFGKADAAFTGLTLYENLDVGDNRLLRAVCYT